MIRTFCLRDLQQRRHGAARAEGPLRSGPDGGFVAFDIGDGAGRADHAVHLKRPAEGSLDTFSLPWLKAFAALPLSTALCVRAGLVFFK